MRLRYLLPATMLACAAPSCLATPTVLTPGSFTYNVGTGTVGSDKLNSVFGETGPNGSISYTDSVYSVSDNPFCANCLAFVISVKPNDLNTTVRNVTNGNFGGGLYQIAVAYLAGTGDAPVFAENRYDGDIFFDFGDQSNDGYSSPDPDALVIYTNAMSYDDNGSLSVSTETSDSDPQVFQPTGAPVVPTVTPEPSSLVLLGTGALGVVGTIRRRLA